MRHILEELKLKSGGNKFKTGADANLLPNEITGYAQHWNFGQAAELQWKTMVEYVLSKQGKFRNSLAVCDVNSKFVDKARPPSRCRLLWDS